MAKKKRKKSTSAAKKRSAKPVKKAAKKKKPARRKKKLGDWKIRRQGENQIVLTIPVGMEVQGEQLTIEDVVAAGTNYMVVKKGRVLACCSGNIAIA